MRVQPGQAESQHDHPAFHKFRQPAYKRALEIVEPALDAPVSQSRLFVKSHFGRWYYHRAAKIGSIRDMVESRNPKSLAVTDLKARRVINLLRNALSHNNLYAFGGPTDAEIENLSFFAEDVGRKNSEKEVLGYYVLAIPVQDMEILLDNWFEMLEEVARKNGAGDKLPAAGLRLVTSKALAEGSDELAAA